MCCTFRGFNLNELLRNCILFGIGVSDNAQVNILRSRANMTFTLYGRTNAHRFAGRVLSLHTTEKCKRVDISYSVTKLTENSTPLVILLISNRA